MIASDEAMRNLADLIMNGQITFVRKTEVEKVDSGEAIGFDRYDNALKRSEAVTYNIASLFPSAYGGRGFWQIWAIDENGEFIASDTTTPFERSKMDVSGLKDAEIVNRLVKILSDDDEKWCLDAVRLLSPTEVVLFFRTSEGTRGGDNMLICDFQDVENVAFEIRQSVTREQAPGFKTLYKLKRNERGERELVLVEWVRDCHILVYRVNLESGLCTRETYSSEDSLVIKNL